MSDGRLGSSGGLDPYLTAPLYRRFDFRADRAVDVLGGTPPVAMAEALRRTFSPASRGDR